MNGSDVADAVVESAGRTVTAADGRVLDKVAACVLVGLAEVCRAGLDSASVGIASALVGTGDRESALTADWWDSTPESLVPALSFLMHSQLRDDSYLTAFHPGQIVIPTALSCGRQARASGQEIIEAILFGYEVSCRLADHLMPHASDRGWRITAVLAPFAAAATAAHLFSTGRSRRPCAASAVRMAAATAGGGLYTVTEGDDWRLQPAIAAPAGILAARLAARGYAARRSALEAPHGVLALIAGHRVAARVDDRPRVLSVMFKTSSAPMYAQGVLNACRTLDVRGHITRVVVHVSAFTASYAGSNKSAASVADIRSVILGHQDSLAWAQRLSDDLIEVVADEGLSDMSCRIRVEVEGRPDVVATGNGDTAHWGFDDACAHFIRESPAALSVLAGAVRGLRSSQGSAEVLNAVLRTVVVWKGSQV